MFNPLIYSQKRIASRISAHGFALHIWRKHDSRFSSVTLPRRLVSAWVFLDVFQPWVPLWCSISYAAVPESRPKAWAGNDAAPGNKQLLFSKAIQSISKHCGAEYANNSLSLRIFLKSLPHCLKDSSSMGLIKGKQFQNSFGLLLLKYRHPPWSDGSAPVLCRKYWLSGILVFISISWQ